MKLNQHRTHYMKWTLDFDSLSIRYHWLWQDKPEEENIYILKHHNNSTSTPINEKMALMLINKHTTKTEEVVAYVTILPDGQRQHNKTVIGNKHISSYRGGTIDTLLHKMTHRFFKRI